MGDTTSTGWTDREDAILAQAVADDLPDAVTAELLPARSVMAIKKRRLKVGLLLRDTPAAPVSDETIRALHARGLSTPDIAEATGLTRHTVDERLSRLRLPANR